MIPSICSRSVALHGAAFMCFLLSVFSSPYFAHSEPFRVPDGSRCSECGMVVNPNSKFAGQVITGSGSKLLFCDIGDMLIHFRSGKDKLKTVYVKDYNKNEWIDGKKAFYIRDKKISTPMSWGITAFGDEAEANKWGSPVDFNGAFKLLK
ncbi:MAG TPA: nitrous oxide reductase accessory protein NosL [Thermodesulfovibrionales bacterium]|nr:nitrous oxide reductase accessory protein NosL [Thermodesulfovibrionales bacterium]